MTHIRRSYLDDLKTQIKPLVTSGKIGGVWIQRAKPSRTAYPLVTLYAENEPVETLVIHAGDRPQDRNLTISIDIWIRGSPDDEKAERDMDKACELVEPILNTPAGADDMQLINTEFQVNEEDPELHTVTLTYQIKYNTVERNPII